MSYARMVTPSVAALLEQLNTRVGRAPARGTWLLWAALVLVVGAVARVGTVPFRWGAATLLVVVTALLVALPLWRRRRERSELRLLAWLFAQEPAQLAKLRRAYHLQNDVSPDVSPQLAALHYRRTLERVSPDVIVRRGDSLRRRWNIVGAVALAVCAGLFARGGSWLLEGYDVLFARSGVAPWDMQWLEYSTVIAKPPAYLGNGQTPIMWESATGLPEGAVVSVHGRPLREGVTLVLTNGSEDVAFVDDGEGALVAHWTLDADAELRVAARFGEVRIFEAVSVQLHAMPDQIPRVFLAGAPREISLGDAEQIEIQWRAVDDHQLSQVDLVLRSGAKEERRTLDRPSPGMRQTAGGHLLYPDDPFITQSFLPVLVRVEARDNHAERERDAWGRSETLVLKPTGVGQAHVARFKALRELRDGLTDVLSTVALDDATAGVAKSRHAAAVSKLIGLRDTANGVLSASYDGLPVARGMAAFVGGQLDTALREFRRPGSSQEKRRRAMESALLAIDAGLASMAHRDAQDVSKALGDVADEAAFAAKRAQEGEQNIEAAQERLELAIRVIEEGAAALRSLGVLGNDLGLVALADLDRVVRAKTSADFFHAELAALHLAARLHRPNPSFGAKGGGGGAVESGNGQGGEGEDPSGKASDADEAFDRLAHDLAELSQEHSDAVDRTASALDDADDQVRSDALAEEAKRRAQALRRATLGLPEPGEAPSTSRASAALSREHSSAMAHDLDNLDFDEAVESGRRARSAAEEALRRGDLDDWTIELQKRALDEIRQQLDWAVQQRDQWQQRREQAAREALGEIAKAEQELGERARRLTSEGRGAAQLPEPSRQKLSAAEELMRQAAQQLGSGRGQVGLQLQRQAQRLLEESQPGQTTEPAGRQSGKPSGTRNSGFGGTVPAEERRRQAEDFRRRVLEGLARGQGGKLGPAVKRYAEGLLR